MHSLKLTADKVAALRCSRQQPGLRPQHLTGIRLVQVPPAHACFLILRFNIYISGCALSQEGRVAGETLQGMFAVQELTNGRLRGGAVGSSEVTLEPCALRCGTHTADTGTAGSCTLLAQVWQVAGVTHVSKGDTCCPRVQHDTCIRGCSTARVRKGQLAFCHANVSASGTASKVIR